MRRLNCFYRGSNSLFLRSVNYRFIRYVHDVRIQKFSKCSYHHCATSSVSFEAASTETNPIFQNSASFLELCENYELVKALERNNYSLATDVQTRSFSFIKSGKDVVIGAETGSGKTLAYLLPLVDRAIEVRKTQKIEDYKTMRGIILAPTSELCDQIIRMTKFITETLKEKNETKIVLGMLHYPLLLHCYFVVFFFLSFVS
jgi:CRISPR/Cas system-associated endonuclease/helicase Cas3